MDGFMSTRIRQWQLPSTVAKDYTTHIKYVSDHATGAWRMPVEEKWEPDRHELGRGSFGVVRMERCISGPSCGSVRAVKQIHKNFGPQELTSKVLSRELFAILEFSMEPYRDCFVQSFGWFDSGDSLFITMEYFPLGDLSRYLKEPLPEAQANRISRQILQGVDFMHQNNFAHRDLKPNNLLVHHGAPNWWVKISDFGTSKQIEETVLRSAVGTEQYQAPEVRGIYHPSDIEDDMDEQLFSLEVDIWGVGAIVFRIVTGQVAFAKRRDLFCFVVQGHSFPSIERVSRDCFHFIQALMAASPRQRPSATQALRYRWLSAATSMTTPPTASHQQSEALARQNIFVSNCNTAEASAEWPLSGALTEEAVTKRQDVPLRPSSGPHEKLPKPQSADDSTIPQSLILPSSGAVFEDGNLLRRTLPAETTTIALPTLTRHQEIEIPFSAHHERVHVSSNWKLFIVIKNSEFDIWEMDLQGRLELKQTLQVSQMDHPVFVIDDRGFIFACHSVSGSYRRFDTWKKDEQGRYIRIQRNKEFNEHRYEEPDYGDWPQRSLNKPPKVISFSVSSYRLRMVRYVRERTTGDDILLLWSVNSQGILERTQVEQIYSLNKRPTSVLMSPDGQLFILTLADGIKQIWRMDADGTYRHIQDLEPKWAHFHFSSDDQWLLTCSDVSIVLWRAEENGSWKKQSKEVPLARHSLFAVSPDGKIASRKEEDILIREFDDEGNIQLKHTIAGQGGQYGDQISFTRDGRRFFLISSSQLIIWDIEE